MTTAPAPTPHGHHPLSWRLSLPTFAGAWRHQWTWLLAGIALSFLIPFVFTDLISIDRDLYYGLYVGSVFTFVGLWLRFGIDSPRELLLHNWRRGVVLGVAFTGVMAAVVFKDPATTHPHGLDFAAAIAWRGVVYGFTDGVLLSVFPILAVFSAFAGKRILERRLGKIAIGALALAVSLLFTAVYHLGYADFRGEKLRKPLLGDVMWSVPTLVTLSPFASPITHAGLHVSAVIHSYDGETFLPPTRARARQRNAQPPAAPPSSGKPRSRLRRLGGTPRTRRPGSVVQRSESSAGH